MDRYLPFLHWIDSRQEEMTQTLTAWGNVCSGTFHLPGLEVQCRLLEEAFAALPGRIRRQASKPYETVDARGHLQQVSLAPSLCVSCRPEAPERVLLAIHMDTVYGEESPFQTVRRLDGNRLNGPGVADAKGGLVVLLYSLLAFERFVSATGQLRLGWDVLINADEEIGSPGSQEVFEEFARQVQWGLLFEPTLPDGQLVSARKGSGNFSLTVHGRAAHAGRDFHAGRNAVVLAARAAQQLDGLNGRWPGMTLNVSRIDGGGPQNMVPEIAVVRCNIRFEQVTQAGPIRAALDELVSEISLQDGFEAELHGRFFSLPKIGSLPLLQAFQSCGRELGLELAWAPVGGACDGNRLEALGVPNVDTLGVRGGKIHSPDEFAILESLAERARLSALFLMMLADQQLPGLISNPPNG